MSYKASLFTAGILALLAIFGLAACDAAQGGGPARNPGTGTYAGHGVSFHYPAGWNQGTPGGPGCGSGCPRLWATGVGLDASDSVDVTANREGTPVTKQNLPEVTPTVTRAQRGDFRQFGGRLLAGPRAITVGGMPGLRFQGTANVHGAASKVTVAVVFNGMTGYFITCDYTPAKARAVQRACAQVLRTFKVSKLITADVALVYRAHGVSFHYPPGWTEGTPGTSGCGSSCQLWAAAVGLDASDSIDIFASRIGTRVTAQNLSTAIPSVTRAVRWGFRHAGDRLLAGPQAITVGGMPGLRFQGTVSNPVGKGTLTLVFNGMTRYDITCDYTPAKARAVRRACAQVLRTFKVS